jgi:uncharacterized SAM-binding protein YcdF (DUF218 family)
MKRLLAIGVLVVSLPIAVYLVTVAKQIERQSILDEAKEAEVIVVLGAAEYNGRPSPVLRARLDHAFDLHRRGLAPRILTTGGAGGDPVFTEGEVGRDYLVLKGIPAEDIIVEGEGDSTVNTLLAVVEIMRRMGLESAILVSDGYHIFRAKKILEDQGITAYGSPRATTVRSSWRAEWLYIRQAVGYVLWRVGIKV